MRHWSQMGSWIPSTRSFVGCQALPLLPRPEHKAAKVVQSISFAAKPLLHAFQSGPTTVNIVILEYNISDTKEHIGRHAFQNRIFRTLNIHLQQVYCLHSVFLNEVRQRNAGNAL